MQDEQLLKLLADLVGATVATQPPGEPMSPQVKAAVEAVVAHVEARK